MEFLDGRIFEDPSIPSVSAEGRNEMWAARRISPGDVFLPDTGGTMLFEP